MSSCAVWTTYIELGATAYQSGDFDIAEMMMKAAIGEAPRQKESLEEFLTALETVADQLARQRQFAKAERLYKRIKTLRTKTKADDNPHICRLLYKLVELNIVDNRHASARRAFAQAYLVTKKSTSVSVNEHANYLARLTTLWTDKLRAEEAAAVYRELMNIRSLQAG